MNQDSKPTQGVASAAKTESDKALSAIKDEASILADDAQQVGRKHVDQQLERGKERVEEHLDTVASAVDDAAERFEAEGHPFASYAGELSSQLMTLSEKIETSSVDELASSTRRLAKENPGLFMLGGVALGIVASRFYKAGQPPRSNSDSVHYDLHQGDSQVQANRAPYNTSRVNKPVNDLNQAGSETTAAARSTQSDSAHSSSSATPGSESTQPPRGSFQTSGTSSPSNATSSRSKES